MTIHDIIAEARAERKNATRGCDLDYKDVASYMSQTIRDVADRHGVPGLVRDMPDGGSCPRSFLDWLDRNE